VVAAVAHGLAGAGGPRSLMSPWLRRRRQAEPAVELAPAPEPATEAPETVAEAPPEESDPTGPLSPQRLDQALARLRQEIPAASEENPPGTSA
jgi:hypothetical protein